MGHALVRRAHRASFSEHTAGSFVVVLAPMSAMLDAAKRRREQSPLPPPASPPTLARLDADTRQLLRALAERSLDALGVRERGPFLEDEMLRLFGSLAAAIVKGEDRERALRRAIAAAMSDYD